MQMVPPAELPEDELTGEQAMTALQFARVKTSAGQRFTVRRITGRRMMETVMLWVGFTDGSSVTVNVQVARVRAVRDALSTLVDGQ